jgi:hypothetical protein
MPFEACFRMYTLMSEFNRPWYIAGGWAVDLYHGKVTREHEDIEIMVFREDQFFLKEYLNQWDIYKVEDNQLKPWGTEFLNLPVHEVHAFNRKSDEKFEILLNETEKLEWKYRRDVRVKLPLMEVGRYTESGIPFLRPEIVLLYKSKNIRLKDENDFMEIKDKLSLDQKRWISNALTLQDPNHHWLEELRK